MPHEPSRAVAGSTRMAMPVAVAVSMVVRMRAAGSGGDSGVLFQFLDSAGVQRPGGCTASLEARMGQSLDDSSQVFLGPLWRTRQRDNQCLISHPGYGP